MSLLTRLLILRDSIEKNYQHYISIEQCVDLTLIKNNQIEASSVSHLPFISNDRLESLHAEVVNSVEQYYQNLNTLLAFLHEQIKYEHDQYSKNVSILLDQLTAEIVIQRNKLLNKKTVLLVNEYEQSIEQIIEARKPYNTIEEQVKLQVNKYVDWRYPGLVFRPRNSEWFDNMVGLDPLYIVDHKKEHLDPSLNGVNDIYKNRLRSYLIDDRKDTDILDQLPKNQFGVVIAYNFFDYKYYSVICRYLKEVYNLLRPGGVFIFTFNDCDHIRGVELVYRYQATYVPGHLLKQAAADIGYKIVYYYDSDQKTTCIELQKPGELSSIRGGQTLARIVPN